MKSKGYGQVCVLASALDIVGSRWTLLIIRELLLGPSRYKDLFDELPGISTNLLSERLKSLERQGLIRRRVLPRPAGSTVYELTPLGCALEPALLELDRWGSHWLQAPSKDKALPSLASIALVIKAFFHSERAQKVTQTFELHFGREILQVHIAKGKIQVQRGTDWKPDVVLFTEKQPFLGLFTGRIDPDEAIAGGLVRIEGDPGALGRFLNMIALQSID